MTHHTHNAGRRRLLNTAFRVTTSVAAACLVPTVAMASDEPPKLSMDDAMAKSLHYNEDASQVQMAAHKQGQDCAACQLYKGKEGEQWGPCQIFPGKRVAAKGWCSSFTARSS